MVDESSSLVFAYWVNGTIIDCEGFHLCTNESLDCSCHVDSESRAPGDTDFIIDWFMEIENGMDHGVLLFVPDGVYPWDADDAERFDCCKWNVHQYSTTGYSMATVYLPRSLPTVTTMMYRN